MTVSCRSAPLRQKPRVRQAHHEGRAARVGDEMAALARLAPVRRVRAGAGPPFWPGQTRCPGKPGSSRSHPPRAGAPALRDAGGSKRPPPANPAAAAGNPCRSRSPSRPAAFPTAAPSAARTSCPCVRPGSQLDAAHPSDAAEAAGGAERSHPRVHRGEAVWPCQTNAENPARCRSVRRSKSVPIFYRFNLSLYLIIFCIATVQNFSLLWTIDYS